MRTRLASMIGLTCLLGLIGGAVVANAGADITSPETFTVLGTVTRFRFIDVGKQDYPPGDVVLFVERLTNEGDDSVVGTARIQCTMHISPWAICIGTFDITGRGQIVGEGMVPFNAEAVEFFDVPVTGGTGDFSNVRGEVRVEPTDTGERDTFTLIP